MSSNLNIRLGHRPLIPSENPSGLHIGFGSLFTLIKQLGINFLLHKYCRIFWFHNDLECYKIDLGSQNPPPFKWAHNRYYLLLSWKTDT